jgi:hypothetical protein
MSTVDRSEYQRQYRLNNKNKFNNKKVTCKICNKTFTLNNFYAHKKTQKHILKQQINKLEQPAIKKEKNNKKIEEQKILVSVMKNAVKFVQKEYNRWKDKNSPTVEEYLKAAKEKLDTAIEKYENEKEKLIKMQS